MKHHAIPMHENMRAVSADQWADAMSSIPNVYQTESVFKDGTSVMYSRLRDSGYAVGEVHYLRNNQRVYYVRPVPGATA